MGEWRVDGRGPDREQTALAEGPDGRHVDARPQDVLQLDVPQPDALLLETLHEETVAALAGGFGLAREVVPTRIEAHTSEFNGSRLHLRTRLFANPDQAAPLSRLHVARGTSDDGLLDSLTVVAVPGPDPRMPLLAADLVALKGSFTIVFLDLCALGGTVGFDAGQDLLHARGRLLAAGSAREVPGFCQGILSRQPVLVREGRGDAGFVERLAACYRAYLEAFVEQLRRPASGTDAHAARAAQRDFMDRMARNKRETRALSRLFGEEWAGEFLHGWFFAPDRVPSAAGTA